MARLGNFGMIGLSGSDIAAGGNTPAHREAYANAVAYIERGGQYAVNMDVANRKRITMTQSFLQTEMPLDVNKTFYDFGVLQNDITNGSAGLYPTEQRLNMQDAFFAYEVGFYVKWMESATGLQRYKYQLMTYPNPQFYGSAGLDLDLMMGLWTNGMLQLSINGNVVTPGWSLTQHLDVRLRQLNTVNWPNTDNFFNPFDGNSSGLVTIEPNWIFNGGNNIDLGIQYKEPMAAMGIANQKLRLVLYVKGFLAQNCSSIMDAK